MSSAPSGNRVLSLRLAGLVFVLCSLSSAQYMADFGMTMPKPLPPWVFSAGWSGHYFAADVDHWITASATRSTGRDWRLGTELGYGPMPGSLAWNFLAQHRTSGQLRVEGSQDHVLMALGILSFPSLGDPACDTCIERVWAPTIGLGYGRDFAPVLDANWGMRMQLRASVLAGESLTRARRGVFGIRESRLAMFYLSLDFGFLWFAKTS